MGKLSRLGKTFSTLKSFMNVREVKMTNKWNIKILFLCVNNKDKKKREKTCTTEIFCKIKRNLLVPCFYNAKTTSAAMINILVNIFIMPSDIGCNFLTWHSHAEAKLLSQENGLYIANSEEPYLAPDDLPLVHETKKLCKKNCTYVSWCGLQRTDGPGSKLLIIFPPSVFSVVRTITKRDTLGCFGTKSSFW